jgi:hypothetical protein
MKNLSLIAGIALIAASCNSNSTDKKTADSASKNNMGMMKADSSEDKDLKMVKATFANVDAGVTASIDKLVSDYMKIKDALVADDTSAASDAAGIMSGDLKSIDKSKFTADQKKSYENNEADLKENAEHINAKKVIDHQREHFGMMSDDMSDLVKAFGCTNTLYTDHCPMANDNKGANWLSATKKVMNPFMGKKDMTCGKAIEIIKK